MEHTDRASLEGNMTATDGTDDAEDEVWQTEEGIETGGVRVAGEVVKKCTVAETVRSIEADDDGDKLQGGRSP